MTDSNNQARKKEAEKEEQAKKLQKFNYLT